MKKSLIANVRLASILSLPTFLFTITITPATLAQSVGGGVGPCISSLIDSGVTGKQAAAACADALEPKQISACVATIQSNTQIAVIDALQACYRVRRPSDLASCVVDINGQLKETDAPLALDNCRRSLLPKHYADCTLGLLGNVKELSGAEAMETCISAEVFPSELDPQKY
jgi:hypothetical protein